MDVLCVTDIISSCQWQLVPGEVRTYRAKEEGGSDECNNEVLDGLEDVYDARALDQQQLPAQAGLEILHRCAKADQTGLSLSQAI